MPSAVVGMEAVVALEATGTKLRDPFLVLDALKIFPSWTSFKKPTLIRSEDD